MPLTARRTTVRENGVSRHHRWRHAPSQLLGPSPIYRIEGFKGIGPPLCRETLVSQTADVIFFQSGLTVSRVDISGNYSSQKKPKSLDEESVGKFAIWVAFWLHLASSTANKIQAKFGIIKNPANKMRAKLWEIVREIVSIIRLFEAISFVMFRS